MSVSTLDTVPFRRSPPGVDGFAPEVVGAIMLRWQQLQSQRSAGANWVRHTLSDGSPSFLNRLLLSDDPLYLQHAHDPVDWRPFGAQAFDEARRRARPVLMWILEPDSRVGRELWERAFSDVHVARSLNRAYVPVLLSREQSDREVERYLGACELLAGDRGEGAVVWATPGRAPYAAWSASVGAWKGGRGLGALLAMFQTHVELPVQASIDRCTTGGRPGCAGMNSAFVGVDLERLEVILDGAADGLAAHWRMYLGQQGARGSIPPGLMRFAMRHGARRGRAELLHWAQDRLEEQLRGAGRDHLGGGYYQDWQGPGRLPISFDKELEYNADLALCFLEAWELSGRRDLFWASDEVLGLVWSELRARYGAFHAALRRPVEGPSGPPDIGLSLDDLREALGESLFDAVQPSLGLWAVGGGRFLVTLPPFSDATEQRGVRRSHIERARRILAERHGRLGGGPVDQRVLPGANGLAVAAMARTARSLDHIGPDARTWLETAETAADSTTQLLWHRGRLYESFLRGARQPEPASFRAHVQLALGFLELFESTGEVAWLRMCLALEDASKGRWPGQPSGRRAPGQALDKRLEELGRAGDAAAWATLLARLATLLSDPQRRMRAMALIRPWFSRLELNPMAYAPLLAAAERVLAEPQVLLVWSHGDAARRAAFLGVLRSVGAPGREVVVTSDDCDLDELPQRLPIAAHHRQGSERAAAYVCGSRSCSRGLETPYALQRFLMGDKPAPEQGGAGAA